MSLLHDAIAADLAGDYVRAAESYERFIKNSGGNPASYINLALLYWLSTDPGFQVTASQPLAFVRRSGARYSKVLNEGMEKYPSDVELRFWRKYIDSIETGIEFSAHECRELLNENPSSRIPCFYLFIESDGAECSDDIDRLLLDAEKLPLAKNRYIASVLSGVLKRRTR